MSKPKRGICPVCKQERALTTEGLMRYHLGLEYVGHWRQICKGNAGPPESLTPDPIADAERRGFQRAIAVLRAEAERVERATVGTDGIGWDAYDVAASLLEAHVDGAS